MYSGCRPKENSHRLTERSLCPFTTRTRGVFAEYDIKVEYAELDRECGKDYPCGEHGSGQCKEVKSLIQVGGLSENVTVAYVCASHKDAKLAAKPPALSQ
ncbi:hypothetical protein FJT64_016318 [Amphibalanus amphitrite]|uniref:Uncharacterized protein n=1 Tax=Amphibalanus amphitrite TaxID=1232801 RepID=A0A6A4XAT6_AMPAM|nr:hypothetical protein FJT64_016318 [Amphibalanus amphitrite]